MTETASAPDRIDQLSQKLDSANQRVDVLALELRAGFAEMRAGFAESRIAVAGVDKKVELVIDSLAEFRADYNGHTHE